MGSQRNAMRMAEGLETLLDENEKFGTVTWQRREDVKEASKIQSDATKTRDFGSFWFVRQEQGNKLWELEGGKYKTNQRKNFFMRSVIRLWNSLQQEGTEAKQMTGIQKEIRCLGE